MVINQTHAISLTPPSLLFNKKKSAPLVTSRKCSSTTEYLLSCKTKGEPKKNAAQRFVHNALPRRIKMTANDPLTKTTYSVPSSSSRSSPT